MTEYPVGNREVIKWKTETSFGTIPSSNYIVLNNAVVTPNIVQSFEERDNGSGGNTLDYDTGNKDVRLTLEYNPQTWRLLVNAIGTATNTDNTTYYTHTFSQNDDYSLDSFTLQRVENLTTSIVHTYNGCKINSYNISWNTGAGIGNYVTCTAECTCQNYSVTESEKTNESSGPSQTLLQGRHVIVKINDTEVESVSGNIMYENNLNDGFHTNSSTRNETNPTYVKVSGSIVLKYTDISVFTLFQNASNISDCSVEFRRTTTTDTAVFPLTNIRISKPSNPTRLKDMNLLTIDYTATMSLPTITDDRSDY